MLIPPSSVYTIDQVHQEALHWCIASTTPTHPLSTRVAQLVFFNQFCSRSLLPAGRIRFPAIFFLSLIDLDYLLISYHVLDDLYLLPSRHPNERFLLRTTLETWHFFLMGCASLHPTNHHVMLQGLVRANLIPNFFNILTLFGGGDYLPLLHFPFLHTISTLCF